MVSYWSCQHGRTCCPIQNTNNFFLFLSLCNWCNWHLSTNVLLEQCQDLYISGKNASSTNRLGKLTGSTNNHISRIFFMLTAPRYWREIVSSTNVLAHYRRKCLVSSTYPLRRTLCIHSAGVSGNENVLLSRWQPNKKKKEHHLPWSQINTQNLPHPPPPPPNPLISHYPLPLTWSSILEMTALVLESLYHTAKK